MIYELYSAESNNSQAFFPRINESARALLEPDAVKIWEYDAKSHFDAMQAYHEHMGWRAYRPAPGEEDTVYPEST